MKQMASQGHCSSKDFSSPWLSSPKVRKQEFLPPWGGKLGCFQVTYTLEKHKHSPIQNPDNDIYNERKYKGFEVVTQCSFFFI